jgi:type I restriction enzyme S subunit
LAEHGIRVLRFWNHEVLRDTESVLEAIYQAIVERREELRPSPPAPLPAGEGSMVSGLPAHLYDLFPDRLVDSELGEVPEGWRVGTLGQVLGELVSGARPKGGAAQEGVPSIGAENVIGLGRYDFSKEKYVPRDFFNELQRKGAAVRPGDVLLYKDGAQIGRKTYFDRGFPHAECAVNEHVFILRAKHRRYQRYLFFWLDQDWMTHEIISLNSNSAQPGINQQGVRGLPLLIPPDSVVEAFDHVSKALTDRLFAACLENRTLAALRDALLPKLIRGEIRVKDAERFLKERGLW